MTFIVCSLFLAIDVHAQTIPSEYQSLVALPQMQGSGRGLAAYFNQLYMIAVAIGAILAFIKISIAGVKWSMSGVITDKSQAREDIKGALLGLAILLIPFIVLNTIYSGLTNLNILENAARVRVSPPSSLGGPQANSGTAQSGVGYGSQTSTDVCTVRDGAAPPPGCVNGSLTANEQEIARLCQQSGSTYNYQTRTCVPPAGSCTTFRQIEYTQIRQRLFAESCIAPNRVTEAPINNGASIQVCCVR